MASGDKAKYTDKQKRRAEHIEASYEARGLAADEATKRAWATVNSIDKGGKASGSGRGQKPDPTASVRGGKAGGAKKKAIRKASDTRSGGKT